MQYWLVIHSCIGNDMLAIFVDYVVMYKLCASTMCAMPLYVCQPHYFASDMCLFERMLLFSLAAVRKK